MLLNIIFICFYICFIYVLSVFILNSTQLLNFNVSPNQKAPFEIYHVYRVLYRPFIFFLIKRAHI